MKRNIFYFLVFLSSLNILAEEIQVQVINQDPNRTINISADRRTIANAAELIKPQEIKSNTEKYKLNVNSEDSKKGFFIDTGDLIIRVPLGKLEDRYVVTIYPKHKRNV